MSKLYVLCECDENSTTDHSQESVSWGKLSGYTHAEQVHRHGFCTCEDNNEVKVYDDCPQPLEQGEYWVECGECHEPTIASESWSCQECGSRLCPVCCDLSARLDTDNYCLECNKEVPCVGCGQPSREEVCSHCVEMEAYGMLAEYVAGKVACFGCDVFVTGELDEID